ncbi:MAG TPA: hypothetical protein PKZ76_05650, partial [Xanthomonadaceae bacterium]|nr:hypothetical protein [Xanthomonadaceae bacterium]
MAADSGSQRLDVPFEIDPGTLRAVVAVALDLDADGRGHLRQDPCNWMDVDALALSGAGDALLVEFDLRASTGAQAFGICIGPGTWRGRMRVTLAPTVDADGLAVLLTPRSAELRRPDGSTGLLTRPARMLADVLILPALGRARLDLAAPLAEIDHLLHGVLGWEPPTPQMLASRSRIVALAMRGDAMNLTLGFDVPPAQRVAEVEPPLDPHERVAWARLEDELDGFLTHVIAALAERAEDPALRIELLGVLLDARHAIAEALAEETSRLDDPVRRLFVESWDRLRPLAASLIDEQHGNDLSALQLAGFLAGGDALRALDALGPEYGVEISREGLRRLARMLLAEQAPATFTPLPLELDLKLRELFRLWPPEAPPGPPAASWLDYLIRPVHASVPDPGEALHQRVPVLHELDDYLGLVADLLAAVTVDRLGA